MKSTVVKRSIVVGGHKTSVSLEDAFWNGLKGIAETRGMTLSDIVAAIDSRRQHSNLSSAIRLFVLEFYRNRIPEQNEERSERVSPPLVPASEGDVLLVLRESSESAAAYVETNPADANENAIVRNMIDGQYDKPLRVIAINVGEGWARDVSRKIAGAVVKEAGRDDRGLPSGTRAFVEAHLGGRVRH